VGLANHTVLIRKDGSEVPIDDSGAPIKDKDNKTTGVVLIFRDITERKETEEKLEEYRNNLERIEESFSAKAVVVFVVDVKREILDRFVKARVTDPGPYFFSDYETFLKMPIGRALYEPIYTWSFDAKLYPLSRNV